MHIIPKYSTIKSKEYDCTPLLPVVFSEKYDKFSKLLSSLPYYNC